MTKVTTFLKFISFAHILNVKVSNKITFTPDDPRSSTRRDQNGGVFDTSVQEIFTEEERREPYTHVS